MESKEKQWARRSYCMLIPLEEMHLLLAPVERKRKRNKCSIRVCERDCEREGWRKCTWV